MDETLITAVSSFPVLFDASLHIYRDNVKKCDAWKKVAEIVGASEEECRKKWKNLRDQYRRERNRERERSKSGSGGAVQKPWRYSQIMSFLNPFLDSRLTSTNLSLPSSSQSSEGSQMSLFEKRLIKAVETASNAGQSSSDEVQLFLLSLLPSLKRLPLAKRAEAKLRIHQIMFEMEFSE
uniref:MADF domain-containing protein n=1 Tax=Astyanax mexicanus TaxID=7994 RepID=A0A3B1JRP6_ASTMX